MVPTQNPVTPSGSTQEAAAIALFRRRGYERTRVQDIIARLLISEATFFNYLGTKDAFLEAFPEEQLDETAANLKILLWAAESPGSRPDSRPDEAVDSGNVVRSRVQRGVGYPLPVAFSTYGNPREKALRNYELFEKLFAEGQRRGEIRRDKQPLQGRNA